MHEESDAHDQPFECELKVDTSHADSGALLARMDAENWVHKLRKWFNVAMLRNPGVQIFVLSQAASLCTP